MAAPLRADGLVPGALRIQLVPVHFQVSLLLTPSTEPPKSQIPAPNPSEVAIAAPVRGDGDEVGDFLVQNLPS
ncbi:MAG: hypothetical protein HY816_18320 [Candidatus Wallbacteria bacterium]|nr:hypothetical protein [Candidatus Wallbacteria bacterium]